MTNADIQRFDNPQLKDRSIKYLRNKIQEEFDVPLSELEVETIVLEFAEAGSEVDEVLLAKVRLLKVLEEDPDRAYQDPLFLVHAVEILNDTKPEVISEDVPVVTSLELAHAVKMLLSMYPTDDFDVLRSVSEYVLNSEGFTTAPFPFTFVEDSVLGDTSNKQDAKDKAKGIRAYLRLMDMLDK